MSPYSAKPPSQLEDVAVEALRLAEADPRHGIILAESASRQAQADGDNGAAAIAERAHGLAAIHLADLDVAIGHLRVAVRFGQRADSTRLTAEARMTLAIALALRGFSRRALVEIDSAIARLSGVERARADAQKGSILLLAGRLDEALACFKRALPRLRQSSDSMWVQRALLNRAGVYAQRQQFVAAELDLLEVERISIQLGLHHTLASVYQNLGYISARQGDVPRALERFAIAESHFRANESRFGDLLEEFGELLLSVRLIREARDKAEQAIEQLGMERRGVYVPEARLLLARVMSIQGAHEEALGEARRAALEFSRLKRPQLAVVARLTALAAEASMGAPSRGLLGRVERALASSEHLSPAAALDAHLLAAEIALDCGLSDRASQHLRIVSGFRLRGPALTRARAWYAEALDRRTSGNWSGALRALRAGLRVMDEFQASLGATDIRAHVAGHRTDLVQLGLRMVLAGRRATDVLVWAELGRATHLRLAPARPPDDPQLARFFDELRGIAQQGDARASSTNTSQARHKQVELEGLIRDRHRHLSGRGRSRASSITRLSLADSLADAALVEFVQSDGVLHAVTVVDGRVRRHSVALVADVAPLIDRLPFALHRVARHNVTDASRGAGLKLLRRTASEIDALLLRPLRELADRPLVVVPTGPLQQLPWSILPSCIGRPMALAPSAALWQAAAARPARGGHVAIASGPGLPGARREARAIGQIYGVRPLLDGMATVEAVRGSVDGAAIAHLATHGIVRADNPLFSSLKFADGPLMVYDLERLAVAPHTVVLAACETGRSVVPAGDELLGVTATFLAMGTAQLVASVLTILDVETEPLMTSLHRRLVSGQPVAMALAAAQQELGSDPAGVASAAGFLCLGAGFSVAPVQRDETPILPA